MFDALTERLSGVFDRLGGRGVLSEKDIDEALREVRVALLEADVALPVVREFIAKAKERASGEAVIRSVRPADLKALYRDYTIIASAAGVRLSRGADPSAIVAQMRRC